MTVDEVDAYLAGLGEPKRTTLGALRRSILAVLPDAEEGISYGMPAFRVDGKVVAGFAAFKNHLAYCRTVVKCSPCSVTASRNTSAPRARSTSRSTSRFQMTWSEASWTQSCRS